MPRRSSTTKTSRSVCSSSSPRREFPWSTPRSTFGVPMEYSWSTRGVPLKHSVERRPLEYVRAQAVRARRACEGGRSSRFRCRLRCLQLRTDIRQDMYVHIGVVTRHARPLRADFVCLFVCLLCSAATVGRSIYRRPRRRSVVSGRAASCLPVGTGLRGLGPYSTP
jgi:hypothetical protein